ncbi:hypothetical protein PV325_000503, partial [Microctonus aethiopoides]
IVEHFVNRSEYLQHANINSEYEFLFRVQGIFSLLVFRMISELRDMSHHHERLGKSEEESNAMSYCTNKYTTLIEYSESIQNIFGLIILQMFISNAVQLCACNNQYIRHSICHGISVYKNVGIMSLRIGWFTVNHGAADKLGDDNNHSETIDSESLPLFNYLAQRYSIGELVNDNSINNGT